MRLEATVPDGRGEAAVKLADELGLSRSQLIDEALALFLKAVVEVRRGRRLVTMEPGAATPACELATPTLSALEWAAQPRALRVPAEEVESIRQKLAAPKKPGARLRAAATKRKR
ncbi:MAG: hypothetical protein U0230_10105 [Polyangiales bacterium]